METKNNFERLNKNIAQKSKKVKAKKYKLSFFQEIDRKLIKKEVIENNFIIFKEVDSSDIDKLVKYLEKVIGEIQIQSINKNKKSYYSLLKPYVGNIGYYAYNQKYTPLHTESVLLKKIPEIIGMLVIQPSGIGGTTTFINNSLILKKLFKKFSKRHVLKVLLKNNFSIKKLNKNYKVSFLKKTNNKFKLKFRYSKLIKSNHSDGIKIHNAIYDIISDFKHINTLKLKKNDLLLFDNLSIMHGRTSFNDINRKILRFYFSANHIKKSLGFRL